MARLKNSLRRHNLGANNWCHLAATFDNATDQVHVYLNGIEVLSTTTTATPSVNSESLTIGKDAAGEYWSGSLDDVRVYNRVLCPTEVLTLYSGAPFGREDHQVGRDSVIRSARRYVGR